VSEFADRILLAPEPAAASLAREFIRDRLRSWQAATPPDPAVNDAVLLGSELVANAVQHAGTGVEVGCRVVTGVVEVTVTDRHPARALPDPRDFREDPYSERGRGLTLSAALASSWGVTYTGAAKTVWFRLRLSPPRPAPAPLPALSLDPVIEPDFLLSFAEGRELGKLDFGGLVRHTVEAARDAVGADAAYALVADEEGELRVRGAVGVAVPGALTAPPSAMLLSGGGVAMSEMSVPFLVDGRVTGVLGVGAAARGRFGDADEGRLQRVADRVAMSLERLRLSELERVRRGRVAFLAEASELLSSTLEERQAVALIAQLMVPRLAAWCAVFLASPATGPRLAYAWHEDEARIDGLTRLLSEIPPPAAAGGPCGAAELTGAPGAAAARSSAALSLAALSSSGVPGAGGAHAAQSWSLAVPPGAAPESVLLAADSAWWFPLTARGRGLGAVVIGRPRDDRRWQDPPPRESLELASDLTRRAGLALDNARLYERQRATSRALQHSLLPPELPDIPRAELAAQYEAAGEGNEVGGDFYDVFGVNGAAGTGVSRWRFAIGDVCGTGPEAAAVTGLARHTLRILAAEGHSIADVMRRLNKLIISEGMRGRFVTLLHGEISVPPAPAPLEVSLVSAGHPLPLLLRAAGNHELPRPAARPQLLLGVQDDCSFDTQCVRLAPGDLLLCVTDGVTERRADDGRLLDDDDGLTSLLAGCRDLSAWAVAARIQRAVSEFGAGPPSDDMAVLVLRATGG
jgi:serine phosphatase RsbU (regulator of sigma subunit)/anti-sigma regulatory factor (Ser/Thr protein kinase)